MNTRTPTPDLVLDPAAETERAARLVRQALTQLGHAYTTQDGRLVQACYRSLSVAGGQYTLLEVDTRAASAAGSGRSPGSVG
jgi:hypothetical protein